MQNFRRLLRAKIHRATVTHADLEYEGSVTIPPDLMAAADLVPYEAVNLWSVTSGARLETYAITGKPGSRDICVNGAAAHLIQPGHVVIIAAFTLVPEQAVRDFEPRVIFVDRDNRIVPLGREVPGPARREDGDTLRL